MTEDFDIIDPAAQPDLSPAKYWIKFLLSRGKHDPESIEGMMSAIQLGGVDADYIRYLDRMMDPPDDFQPSNLRHRASQAFLRQEGIYEAWHRPPAFREAHALIGAGELRALVETFILSPLRPHQAIKKIKYKTGVEISKKAYRLFEHYWWNRNLMSGAEWGDYVMRREVAHQEWLHLAVNATGASGAQMLMWKTGSMARLHIESGRIFKDMRDVAYMCFMQRAHGYPSEEHAKTLLNYTRIAALAQEQLDASSNAMVDIVEHFNQFRMKREKIQTPSIQQLTGGNFSGAEDLSSDKEKLEDY